MQLIMRTSANSWKRNYFFKNEISLVGKPAQLTVGHCQSVPLTVPGRTIFGWPEA